MENIPEVLWQLPVATILVFVVIKFLEHLRGEREATNALLTMMNRDNVTSIKEMHHETLNFINIQAEINREFLKTQRDSMNEGMTRLAEEIKAQKIDHIRELAEITGVIDHLIEKIERSNINELQTKTIPK